ncbi:dipeptide/oligopeptide/nickel ABC transporter ATP-binding protein [Brachybacterium vulturis]|uniref:Dipeptide/oligopeptide/nickel ABC transporter ATP-binding protein n=1 Tax=Brachybacterium vulturis TaxID=2017484 RepID=A0A291GMQ9_9MICO|nr:ABC transporter ATP-binding protein [Brachybacterium vulturis]ATG51488.1 dipeptide/oligopeptide/nickel ABC transporter ATP-binding protein [Brachybacterium vulturis]
MTTATTHTADQDARTVAEAPLVPVETTQQIIERLEGSPLLLEAEGLDVTYVVEEGEVPACRDIDIQLRRGEILGIAGESASGKSTLLNALSRLQRPPAVTSAGSVRFHPDGGDPVDLTALSEDQLRRYRWDSLSIVMQSAMASLNPVLRLETQFIDVIMEHDRSMTKASARARAGELLEMVGIPSGRLRSYSYQLSGGMQQRALIALSLASNPEVVFMDEPTTAVDVVMQRQILTQILQLQATLGFAIVFVTHDLSLLLEISDRITIMYGGRIVEVGMPEQLYSAAQHPYTRGLRAAFPPLSEPVRRLRGIPGNPPDLLDLPTGCSFAPRCPLVMDRCRTERPELVSTATGVVACHRAGEGVDEVLPDAAATGATRSAAETSASARATTEHQTPTPTEDER